MGPILPKNPTSSPKYNTHYKQHVHLYILHFYMMKNPTLLSSSGTALTSWSTPGQLSSSGLGQGPRSGPGQVLGQVQKVQDLDLVHFLF